MPTRRLQPSLKSLCLLVFFGIVGCQAAPPVQEMSDARQAIMVAQEAGAADVAAAEFQAAKNYLESAERSLGVRDYVRARRDAIAAKDKALAALQRTERATDADPE